MINKIKELMIKYREIIVYLIVGGMTTVFSWFWMFFVNIVIFGNPLYPTPTQNLILSVVNWTAGVIFAYPTNRKFVFKSKNPHILQEAGKFVASRISTLILEILVRQVFGWLDINVYVTTIVAAVLVIVGNYVFSKLLVFRKK
ncbi:MAG: GtrA family protein [Lachnospiraceae bacterium]|nr:GtrA family protein [Lachnospiraceae bacterium]